MNILFVKNVEKSITSFEEHINILLCIVITIF